MQSTAHLAAAEGNLPCIKYLVSNNGNALTVLSARNDHGETPKDLAQQFYKDNILEYISHIEYETDHPEEEESELWSLSSFPKKKFTEKSKAGILFLLSFF